MDLIRGLHNLKERHRHSVLTIGNFDGVHYGHQALLKLLAEMADKHQASRCLMTFDPLPHEYFSTESATPRLMNTREKIIALTEHYPELCPEQLLLLNFDDELSAMSAEQFVREILVDALAVRAVVIGDDFRFGQDRSGNLEMLQDFGAQFGFEATALPTQQFADQRVSSTQIREALLKDQFELAEKMLHRPYQICGRVAHGDKRGRSIGFPTANIHLHRPHTPLYGVYSVTMHSGKFGPVPGIANVGRRPTVNGERVQLEVHLFNFNQDIYGQHVCVSFHQKIRDELKFESFDDLKEQIKLDCVKAKAFHAINEE
jgi:riboflavin kinase/FMN adenylyltransferase